MIKDELDQQRWKFIAAASQALPFKASKVRFVRGLAQVRTTTSYVTSHSHGLGDIVTCHAREANIIVDVGAHDRIHGIQEVIKAIHSEQQSVSYEALEIETLAFVLTESLENQEMVMMHWIYFSGLKFQPRQFNTVLTSPRQHYATT